MGKSTEGRSVERLLRLIVEGTAAATGEDFLHGLTRSLAAALGVRYAFVGEFAGPARDRARIISFWNGIEHTEPFEYPLEGTPCGVAAKEAECFYPERVQRQFPQDEALVRFGVDCYLGIRLQSAKGEALGLLTVMDSRTLEHEELVRPVLRIFAARAGAEIERLRSIRLLAASERRFGKMFRATPLAMLLTRFADGAILDMNDAACELLGCARGEMLGRTTIEAGIWADPSGRARAVQMLRDTGSVRALEHELRRSSGETRIVREWLELIELEGEPCIVGSILDVTEQRRSEEALRAANERLQLLIQSSPLAIYTRDANGLLTSWNPAAENMFGWKAAEVLGKPLPTVPEEARAESDALRMRLLAGEPSIKYEGRRLRRDGSAVEVDAFLAPLRDASGNISGIITVAADITERKRAERKLRKREAQLRLLTENIPAAVSYTDRDLVVQVANRRFVDLYCGAGGKALGRHARDVVGERAWPGVAKQVAKALAGEPVVYERTLERADGERREIEVHFEPDRAPGGEVRGYYAFILDITERKRAEEALRESEERFRGLTEVSSDWYWETDENHRFINMAHAPSESAPLRAVNAIGKTRWEANPESLSPEEWAEHRRQLEAHEPFRDFQYERPSVDGRMRWVSVSGLPILDKDGRFKGYRGVGRDITERKRTENVLRLLSTGMAHLAGDAFFNEIAGRVAEYLKAEIGFVGRLQAPENTRIRFVGLSIDGQVMPPLEFDLAGSPCDAVIGKEALVLPERVQERFPGLRMAAELGASGYAAAPLFDSHGTPIGAVGVMSRAPLREKPEQIEALLRLFAVRTAAEIERQSAEARFRDLFEFSTDACVIVTEAGIVTAANRRAKSLFGYPGDELVGLPVERLVPEGSREKHALLRRDFHAAARSRPMGSGRTDLHGRRKDGTIFPADIDLHPLRTDEGMVIVATVRDLTAQRQAEERRAALEAQLRQAQKMEAIGTLAGGIAHDFNNVLGAILGNAELARADLGAGHPAAESIAEIVKAGRRARDLVQQILAFSRKQAPARRVLALGPVVEDSLKLLRATLPASVRLAADCPTGLPNVSADPTQIQEVLINLCTNAWHAMQGRPGHIELRLDEVTVDAARALEHAGLKPGRYVRLSVRDTGKGMDEATKERIFEPFFTTKPAGEGTGLGLAVVHGIVQAHEGAIAVESTPGKGTTFRLYFPAVDLPAEAEAPRPAAPALPSGRQPHVLYLDDDDALVFLVTRMLARQGCRVSGFMLAEEALDALRADPGGFDLVVSDYNMPGMSGLDVAREVSRIRPDLPVAVTSGYITDELREKAPQSGVRHLIYKPDTADELCDVVRRLVSAP